MEKAGDIARKMKRTTKLIPVDVADSPDCVFKGATDELVISERKLRDLESIELIRRKREEQKQDIVYGSRPFILCGLPVRRPPKGELEHIRRNGKFFLRVTGDPRYGLPFGQDRLLPLWVSNLAYKRQSRIVTFDSAAEILECFGLPKDGRYYKRLVQGFKRIFTSTIFFGTEEQLEAEEVWDWTRFHFFDHMRVWYRKTSRDQGQPPGDEFRNVIVLSEHFWNEVKAHPIPVELESVKRLADSPGELDFYCWLVWRCYVAKKLSLIPLAGPGGLMGQLGISNRTTVPDFRKQLRRWLLDTKTMWPDCPAELSADGKGLWIKHVRAISGRKSTSPKLGQVHSQN